MSSILRTPPEALALSREAELSLTGAARDFARAHAQRFQGLVDAIAEMVWITDAAGRPLDATYWQAYTGQTAADMEHDGWAACIHPADRATVAKGWRESLETGRPFEANARFRRHDGEYRWFRSQARPLRDANGEIREWIGIATDVDAHHRTEEQFRVLNARLLAVIRLQTAIAAAATDRDAIERLVAQSVRALVNADVVAVGRPDGDAFAYPNVVGSATEPFRVPLAGSLTGWCVQHRQALRCDDMAADPRAWASPRSELDLRSGLWVPLIHGEEVMGVLTALSHRPAAFGDDDLQTLSLLAGILAISLANARAAESRAVALRLLKFQAQLLESVDQAVIAADLQGNVTYWNACAERLFGWKSAEVIGRPGRALIIPPDQHEASRALGERILRGESYSGDFEYVRKDGTRFTGHNTTTLIPDAHGNPVGMIAVCRDVTKERELEDQLRHSQKMQAVGQLAGGVAHDFNNLLTAISSYTELLHDAVTDPHLRADIAEIRKAAARGADLTKQMLAFSRKQLVQPVVFDAGETVRELEKMLRRVISERIVLRIECAEGTLPLYADRTQLEQVVVNLVVNARDAIEAAGTITVRAARESASSGAGWLRLEVEDTGCGMAPEILSRVFEPFFTTKPAGKGTGLGLSVVHGIVEQLHGAVAVESTPGVGSRFTVRLPLAHVVAEPSGRQVGTDARAGGGERILLVEDNAALLTLCRRVLQKHGYEVVAADSPDAALAAARGEHFDLIVTDMVMPTMNGTALVERLAALGVRAPVLYVSGYTEEDVVALDVTRRRSAFLPKPFTPRELAQRVREMLDVDLPGR